MRVDRKHLVTREWGGVLLGIFVGVVLPPGRDSAYERGGDVRRLA